MEPSAADRDRTRLLAEEMTDLDFEALAPEDPAVDALVEGVWSLEESGGVARLTALLAAPAGS